MQGQRGMVFLLIASGLRGARHENAYVHYTVVLLFHRERVRVCGADLVLEVPWLPQMRRQCCQSVRQDA